MLRETIAMKSHLRMLGLKYMHLIWRNFYEKHFLCAPILCTWDPWLVLLFGAGVWNCRIWGMNNKGRNQVHETGKDKLLKRGRERKKKKNVLKRWKRASKIFDGGNLYPGIIFSVIWRWRPIPRYRPSVDLVLRDGGGGGGPMLGGTQGPAVAQGLYIFIYSISTLLGKPQKK